MSSAIKQDYLYVSVRCAVWKGHSALPKQQFPLPFVIIRLLNSLLFYISPSWLEKVTSSEPPQKCPQPLLSFKPPPILHRRSNDNFNRSFFLGKELTNLQGKPPVNQNFLNFSVFYWNTVCNEKLAVDWQIKVTMTPIIEKVSGFLD